jgi:HK97 family phage portal protein
VPIEFVNDDSIFLGQTFANESVTNKNSVRLVPVWAAVQLVAGAVGSLPLHVYRTQPDGTRIETPKHPVARLLDTPNAWMDGGELIETAMGHLLLWGNAFLYKIKDADGKVNELWPINPQRVKVAKDGKGVPYYVLDGDKGPYTGREFIHIRGLSFDGLVGLSPIQMARQGLGTYAAVEKYAGKFWANNATPGGVLTHPQRLSPEAAERLRAQWHASHGGTGNASRVAILEEGMKFEPMSLPLEDAQMVQQMELSTLNVARLFQIPAHMLQTNANGSSLTYTTTAMEYEHFVRFTLRRWLARWEKSLMRDPDLLSTNGLGSQFSVKFDTTDLTRGDTKTIADINLALFKEGIVTRDEVRADLNRGPIENVADAPADVPVGPSDGTVTGA